ncbi:MAG TPA: adventurous gliding motility protein GltJ [Anaeromyxobacter sp.]
MKFTCESCSAQYMISDEKVGPSGVKVRCKKCGNVILVRRGAAAPAGPPAAAEGKPAAASEPAAASPAASPAPSPGLDAELGQAFDHAFGDTPPSTPAPGASPDMAATQLMGSDDAAKVFSDKPAPTATEWYVAIGQAQVGPLPLAEVKKKWEAGDVGPDSLVWRPGMGDWAPLTTVPDLAGYLAPVPRASPQPSRASEQRLEAAGRVEGPTPTPAEPTWKPVGASALAALASEEIASRASPEPRPAVRPAQGGVKSLVDALPDGGGVDPTGALPLNIKALEATTGEKKLERRSSVARGAEAARHRRSTTRAVVVGVVIGMAVVAGAAAGGIALYRKMAPPPAPAVAARPPPSLNVPLPPPPVPVAKPAPEAPPPQPAVAVAPPAAAAPAPAEPPAAKEPPPKAEKRAANGARHAKSGAKAARAEPPARREPPRKEPPRVVSAQQPPPTPAPATRKKGDGLLDFEGNDKALDDALGGSGGTASRSVYVPPARAGGGALPDKVSPGDINAAVAQRIDALRRCVSEQKAREPDASGTLKMRWVIQGDGSASDVKCLTAQYAQGAFAQCIAGIVKGIKFPRSSTTGQEVTFPFNF